MDEGVAEPDRPPSEILRLEDVVGNGGYVGGSDAYG